MFATSTRGKVEAAAVVGASAAFVTDLVIAAIPTTARAADAVTAYFRKSLLPSSDPGSLLSGMKCPPRIARATESAIKGLSKKPGFLRPWAYRSLPPRKARVRPKATMTAPSATRRGFPSTRNDGTATRATPKTTSDTPRKNRPPFLIDAPE